MGWEVGRGSLQKPMCVRPTFGGRALKPSSNPRSCSRRLDPRPTAGAPPGLWGMSAVTGRSHLGDPSRHVAWVSKTHSAHGMYTCIYTHTHRNKFFFLTLSLTVRNHSESFSSLYAG